ncbi:hypothetical protein HAX54_021446 [Datura stramonium]|uniref:Uncharacterized protein n=1 Tax=Datura stramonium TaxID=4076 RepID=A0ABS8S3D9_DATST|nr:hypothetical protein [Datura stramonium]
MGGLELLILYLFHGKIFKVSNDDAKNDDNRDTARVNVFTDVVDAIEMKNILPMDSLCLNLLNMNQDKKDATKTLDFQVWTLNMYDLRNVVNILLQVEEFILGRGSVSGSGNSGNNKGDHGGADAGN